jgi:hypothetical protein
VWAKTANQILGNITDISRESLTQDTSLNGLIRRIEPAKLGRTTADGIRVAVFDTKLYTNSWARSSPPTNPSATRPIPAPPDQSQRHPTNPSATRPIPAPPELRADLHAITRHVDAYVDRGRLRQAA